MKEKIAICSTFRNSMEWCGYYIDQVSRYFRQMEEQQLDWCDFHFYLAEGDSLDDTWATLKKYEAHYPIKKLLKVEHKTTFNGTKAEAKRLEVLSYVGDTLLASIDEKEKYSAIWWIESDLIIQPNLFQGLYFTQSVMSNANVMVSTPVYIGNQFYDIWGFRDLNGQNLLPSSRPQKSADMSSVGSLALWRSLDNSMYQLRFQDGAFVRLCQQAREDFNYRICMAVDESIPIVHHPNKLVNHRWI